MERLDDVGLKPTQIIIMVIGVVFFVWGLYGWVHPETGTYFFIINSIGIMLLGLLLLIGGGYIYPMLQAAGMRDVAAIAIGVIAVLVLSAITVLSPGLITSDLNPGNTTTPTTSEWTNTTTVTYGTPYTEWVLIFGCENEMPGIYDFSLTFTTPHESKTIWPFTEAESDHAYFIYENITPSEVLVSCSDNGPVQIYGGGSISFPIGWNPDTRMWFDFYESGSNYLVMRGSVRWHLVYTFP